MPDFIDVPLTTQVMSDLIVDCWCFVLVPAGQNREGEGDLNQYLLIAKLCGHMTAAEWPVTRTPLN